MARPLRVLFVEDSLEDAAIVLRELTRAGYDVQSERVDTEADLLAALERQPWDIVLSDFAMPEFNGLRAFELIKEREIDIPFIFVSGRIGEDRAAEAMKRGAGDYVLKDNLTRLVPAIRRELKDAEVRRQRSQAERALHEREHQLSSIYNTVADIIFQLAVEKDGRYRFVSVNQAFRAVTGLDHDQVVGKWVHEIIPEPSLTLVLGKYEEAIREKKIVAWEETTDYPMGRLTGEVSVAPIFDDAGTCTHLVGAVHDTTARKRAEEYLRESEERYRGLIEGSRQGLVIIQEEKISFCNQAFATLFGFARSDEMIGMDPGTLAAPADRESVVAHYRAQLAGEQVAPLLKHRGIRRDGTVIWLESMRQLVSWVGRPAIQSTCIDITNEKHLEEQLLGSQRMEAVGRLAGGIAHDFNNMLAVMSSYGELAMDQLEENHSARKDVQVMVNATQRAAALTRQLLAFSRRQILELKVLDVNLVVATMEKMLLRVIGEDIHLRTNLEADIGSIRADESQIEQIIMNLAVNARDAMPTGGTLTIETARKHLDEHYVKSHLEVQPGDYVMLAVTDTGTGMDEETQRRIFEPFFTTKPLGKGTGLGLSTVYGIVKQMEGLIYVYSEPGKGTCFKVYFPLVKEPAVQESRAAQEISHLHGHETILLVEDDEHVREATRRILVSGGYQVLVAENGPHALQLAKEHPGWVHLLISDVVMPNMSGKEVLDAVSSLGLSRVLFMSGYTDDSIVNHGILDGDYPFLHKPFSKDGLLKKVREVLNAPPMTPSLSPVEPRQ